MESKCPNCQVRPADTDVEYDEVLGANFRSEASRRGRRVRSFSSTITYGHTRLCAQCAASYQRMVWLRTTGRRIANYGFAGIVVGAVIFGIGAAAVPGLSTSVAGLVLATPMALALVAVLVGSVLFFIGLAHQRSATRFIGRASAMNSLDTSAPVPTAANPAVAGASLSSAPQMSWTRLSPEERAAARARRIRRRRLAWIGLGVAWVVAVVAVVLILANTIGH